MKIAHGVYRHNPVNPQERESQDPISLTNWKLLRKSRGFLVKCSMLVCCHLSFVCGVSWGAASQAVGLTDVQARRSSEPQASDAPLGEEWHMQQEVVLMLRGSSVSLLAIVF